MPTVGIIAEYNPFHSGHLYHLQKARELTGADHAVIVMSASFVQRGEPAVLDKYTRARMALENGADCVIELPSVFATGGARTFASAAVSLLVKSHLVDSLVFGSESGDIKELTTAAESLLDESPAFTAALTKAQRAGASYPSALDSACLATGKESLSELLASPNNLLGVEYLKALKLCHSEIRPHTIKRLGDYNSETISEYPSALAIRQAWKTQAHDPSLMPLFADDFTDMLAHALLTTPPEDYSLYEDVSPDLANRIAKAVSEGFASWEELLGKLKNKSVTRAHLSRALLHILLQIRKSDLARYKEAAYGSYLRVLGFRSSFAGEFSKVPEEIPLVMRPASDQGRLDPLSREILQSEFHATDLYNAILRRKYQCSSEGEFTRKLLVIPS